MNNPAQGAAGAHSGARPVWSTTAVAIVCQALSIGLLSTFGFFVAPVAEEFGVGVAVINIGPVFLLLAPALVGPVAGRMADSYSIRGIMLVGTALAGAALLGLAQASTLLWACLAFLGFAIGQSLYGPLIVSTLLLKTYQARAARALGIAALGTSLGAILLPYLVAWLMEVGGWRETVWMLALGISLCLLLVIRAGLPRYPPVAEATPAAADAVAPVAFIRRPEFWIIGAVAAIVGNIALVAVVSYAPHFGNLGFSIQQTATFIAAAGVAGFIAKLFVAGFVDGLRGHLKPLALCILCCLGTGVAILMLGQSYWLCLLGTCFIGAAGGAFIPFHPYLNSAYFDAAVIGSVNGAQAPLMLPLGLIGMPLAGYVYDVTGAYQLVFGGGLGLALVAAVLLLVLPKPQSGEGQKNQ